MNISSYERNELLKAWIAVSFAFSVMLSGGIVGIFSGRILTFFVLSALTVGVGFLLHELAHKMLAIKYGCWAEFRSDNKMLLFMIFLSFFGFVFAAPGAVIIHGFVDKEKNGKISLVGPLTNILLALLFLMAGLIVGCAVGSMLNYGFLINSWLGLFNMLPFGAFDGAKVFLWNKIIFGITIGVAAVLVFVASAF